MELRFKRMMASLMLIAMAGSGCAYQLNTGHRDLDGGCRFIEDCTAPVANACVWTGEHAAALVGLVALSAVPESSDDLPAHHPEAANPSAGGDDPPNATPLR
jgi:hypothetical protein